MSGIVGFISNKRNKKKIIKSMLDVISHRGSNQHFYITDHVTLGVGHLKIKTIKEEIPVVLDGKIINKDELLKELNLTDASDEELIYYGYEKWEEDLPKYLRGSFAFVIYDEKNNLLYGARDHFGIKPFYYNSNEFIFASEIKAILAFPKFLKELNEDVIGPYLTYNFNPCDETFFKGIFTLNPGHYFIYQNEKLEIKKYFQMEFKEEKKGPTEFIEEIADTIKDSVKRSLENEKTIGSFLSSGIDSSYLVCLAHPKKTFTVGYAEQKYNEINYAKELSEKLGIENVSRIINKDEYLDVVPKIMYHFDEPISDPAAIALYFGAQLASREVDVITSGEGADEFFGGYGIYQDLFKFSTYSKLPFFIRRIISKIVSLLPPFKGSDFLIRRGQRVEEWYTGINWCFKEKELKKYLNKKSIISTRLITGKIYEKFKGQNDLNKMLGIDAELFLAKNFLANGDKMASANSLEVCTPFTDTKVFDVASKLPFIGKINRETTKIYLRSAAKKTIPNDSYKKKKLPFPVPLREWVKEDLYYKEIKRAFVSPMSKKTFNVDKIIRLLNEHKQGKKDNYKKIWSIYCFIKWYYVYFEK